MSENILSDGNQSKDNHLDDNFKPKQPLTKVLIVVIIYAFLVAIVNFVIANYCLFNYDLPLGLIMFFIETTISLAALFAAIALISRKRGARTIVYICSVVICLAMLSTGILSVAGAALSNQINTDTVVRLIISTAIPIIIWVSIIRYMISSDRVKQIYVK